jgi:SET domain-containing protein
MFLVRTHLHPSPIHGIGVFAAEPIRKGEVVWQFDPRLDLRIPVSELPNFPPAVQEYLRVHAYIEDYQGRKFMVQCADSSQFVNHSSNPNLIDSPDGLLEMAGRDIAIGEELTCNYYVFDLGSQEKLGSGPVEPH